MPYTLAQCRKFAVMAARGEKVPDDWRLHCRESNKNREPVRKKK